MKNYKVGQTLYYVVCDFDSAEIIKGVIETVEDDHIILAKDGITYWLDEGDDIFESEEEAVACLKKKKRCERKNFRLPEGCCFEEKYMFK